MNGGIGGPERRLSARHGRGKFRKEKRARRRGRGPRPSKENECPEMPKHKRTNRILRARPIDCRSLLRVTLGILSFGGSSAIGH